MCRPWVQPSALHTCTQAYIAPYIGTYMHELTILVVPNASRVKLCNHCATCCILLGSTDVCECGGNLTEDVSLGYKQWNKASQQGTAIVEADHSVGTSTHSRTCAGGSLQVCWKLSSPSRCGCHGMMKVKTRMPRPCKMGSLNVCFAVGKLHNCSWFRIIGVKSRIACDSLPDYSMIL